MHSHLKVVRGRASLAPLFVLRGIFVVTTLFAVAAARAQSPCNPYWIIPGDGPDATVESIATLGNGDVVVGGAFGMVGGIPRRYITRWNGSAWTDVGIIARNHVSSLDTLP